MATLTDYIYQVQNLLHDANSVFWSNTQLTNYINEGREQTVRDTGCLRTLQTTYTPLAPNGEAATIWSAGATWTTGQYIFNNIFMYVVTSGGVAGPSAPNYPTGTDPFPPSTPFPDGTAMIEYVSNCEVMPFAYLPNGINTYDVLGINLYWGNSRIPLRYYSWSNFSAQVRYWQNFVGRPISFSVYGQQQIYIAPIPDQVYAIEVDTNILPTALTLAAPTAVDSINDPYSTCVQYYAAYKAKFYEQSYGEAEIFKQQYTTKVLNVLNSTYTRRIPNPYSSPY